jgi:TonB family protein
MKTIAAIIIALLVSLSCTATSQDVAQTVSPGVRAPGQQQVPDIVLVDTQPQAKSRVEPVYPREALEKGAEGKVWVKILIDTTGRPDQVEVLKSENDVFNEATLTAARQWRFTPAMKDNRPVAVWVTMPFLFKLADKKSDQRSEKSADKGIRIREELQPKVELVFAGDAAARTVISPEAYLVDGARFVSLSEALFGKEKGKAFAGESKRQSAFLKISLSEDGTSATMLMKTETAKKTEPHWHTINWVREKGGEWKITQWHASR